METINPEYNKINIAIPAGFVSLLTPECRECVSIVDANLEQSYERIGKPYIFISNRYSFVFELENYTGIDDDDHDVLGPRLNKVGNPDPDITKEDVVFRVNKIMITIVDNILR